MTDKIQGTHAKLMQFLSKYHEELILYIVMFLCGLFQIIGLFKSLSFALTQFVIVLIGIIIFWKYYRNTKEERKNFVIFSVSMLVAIMIMMFIGHETGLPFGRFNFRETLNAKIAGVPIAVAFIWYSVLFSSFAILQRTKLYQLIKEKAFAQAIFIAFLLMIFDAYLEPVAMKLDFWKWKIGIVPFQNYLSWLILGIIFSYIAVKMKIFTRLAPNFALHAYIASLLYFILIYFA